MVKANFRRRVYAIPREYWEYLIDRLVKDRGKLDRKLHTRRKLSSTERDIEDRLVAAHLRPFRRHGYDLELQGRQYHTRNGGIADILALDRKTKRHVIIELKLHQANRLAVGQLLSYCASIAEEFPDASPPIGLLVAERLDNEAEGIINLIEDLDFIQLDNLLPAAQRT